MLGGTGPGAAPRSATIRGRQDPGKYVADSMGRSCARPACGGSATTTLSYDYANATVWIEPLHAEAHPMNHDLCERHAARLSVPRGWTLVDGREAAAIAIDEPGRSLAPTAPATDAWDPSGTVHPDAVTPSEAAGDTASHDGAVVLEPTLFGDWSADDERHSLAS